MVFILGILGLEEVFSRASDLLYSELIALLQTYHLLHSSHLRICIRSHSGGSVTSPVIEPVVYCLLWLLLCFGKYLPVGAWAVN